MLVSEEAKRGYGNWRLASVFAAIARHAGRHNIIFGMVAAVRQWHYVILRQTLPFSAISASVCVEQLYGFPFLTREGSYSSAPFQRPAFFDCTPTNRSCVFKMAEIPSLRFGSVDRASVFRILCEPCGNCCSALLPIRKSISVYMTATSLRIAPYPFLITRIALGSAFLVNRSVSACGALLTFASKASGLCSLKEFSGGRQRVTAFGAFAHLQETL